MMWNQGKTIKDSCKIWGSYKDNIDMDVAINPEKN